MNLCYWRELDKTKYVTENMWSHLVKKAKVYLQEAVPGKKIFIQKIEIFNNIQRDTLLL